MEIISKTIDQMLWSNQEVILIIKGTVILIVNKYIFKNILGME